MFGPYQLERLLGRGGMGEVFEAIDTRKNRRVAVKRLPESTAHDAAFATRFRRESESAATLHEPHIIPIHDYGEIDGRLFIEMRLVRGVDLSEVLAGGPLPVAVAVDVISQIADALDAAHAEGLWHRDIKPSNILLSRERRDDGTGADRREFAYLVDFGIAQSMEATNLTSTGVAVGTMTYMAPERFLAPGECDERVDVYGLGCVLYEALTGEPPFPGTDLPSLMYAHVNTPPPRPSLVIEGLSTGFDEILARGLAKAPDERYRQAGDLARDTRAVLRATPPPAPPGPHAPPGPRLPGIHEHDRSRATTGGGRGGGRSATAPVPQSRTPTLAAPRADPRATAVPRPATSDAAPDPPGEQWRWFAGVDLLALLPVLAFVALYLVMAYPHDLPPAYRSGGYASRYFDAAFRPDTSWWWATIGVAVLSGAVRAFRPPRPLTLLARGLPVAVAALAGYLVADTWLDGATPGYPVLNAALTAVAVVALFAPRWWGDLLASGVVLVVVTMSSIWAYAQYAGSVYVEAASPQSGWSSRSFSDEPGPVVLVIVGIVVLAVVLVAARAAGGIRRDEASGTVLAVTVAVTAVLPQYALGMTTELFVPAPLPVAALAAVTIYAAALIVVGLRCRAAGRRRKALAPNSA